MTHEEYETLVRTMVQELTATAHALGPCTVNGGAQNRVTGASGFAHPIDATVNNSTDLLLIECKYWTEPVDVEPVLVLAARMADISAVVCTPRVHGSLVSTKEPTAGARTLAEYFRSSRVVRLFPLSKMVQTPELKSGIMIQTTLISREAVDHGYLRYWQRKGHRLYRNEHRQL